MTLIVSDNSPLNLFVQVGLTQLLPALFTTIVIPDEVAREMRHSRAPDSVRAFIADPPAWLSIRSPSHLLRIPRLDPGETAAISLAVELNAVLMIDESLGREAAVAHGLKIVGAVGVLEAAANRGLISDLKSVHDSIRKLRFHIADALLDQSLARHLAVCSQRPSP